MKERIAPSSSRPSAFTTPSRIEAAHSRGSSPLSRSEGLGSPGMPIAGAVPGAGATGAAVEATIGAAGGVGPADEGGEQRTPHGQLLPHRCAFALVGGPRRCRASLRSGGPAEVQINTKIGPNGPAQVQSRVFAANPGPFHQCRQDVRLEQGLQLLKTRVDRSPVRMRPTVGSHGTQPLRSRPDSSDTSGGPSSPRWTSLPPRGIISPNQSAQQRHPAITNRWRVSAERGTRWRRPQ